MELEDITHKSYCPLTPSNSYKLLLIPTNSYSNFLYLLLTIVFILAMCLYGGQLH